MIEMVKKAVYRNEGETDNEESRMGNFTLWASLV